MASDKITITRILDGSDSFYVILTNESHMVPCTSAGVPLAGEVGVGGNAITDVRAFRGKNELTAVSSGPATGQFSISIDNGTHFTKEDENTVRLESFTDNTEVCNITVTFGDTVSTIIKPFYVSKSKAGADSTALISIVMDNESHTFGADRDGFVDPADYVLGNCKLSVFNGVTQLNYGALSVGVSSFVIADVIVFNAGAITITQSTDGQDRVFSPSNFRNNSALVSVLFTVRYQNAAGDDMDVNYRKSISYTKAKAGSEGEPHPPVYYILPLDGVTIKNSAGSINIEPRVIENGIDSQLSSTDFNFYRDNGTGQNPRYELLDLGWPVANFTDADINSKIVVVLAEETAASTNSLDKLDSQSLIDVTDGAEGAGGKTLSLASSGLIFRTDDKNVITGPSSVVITASIHNEEGGEVIEWTTSPSVTLTGTNPVTLSSANFGSQTFVSVTATIQGTSISDSVTVYRAGSGESSFTIILSNENHTFASDSDGFVDPSEYPDGVCEVSAYYGSTQLSYNAAASGGNEFKIGTPIVANSGLNVGVSDGGAYAIVTPSNFTLNGDIVNLPITVYADGPDGSNITRTLNRSITYTKSIAGAQGASHPREYRILTLGGTQIKNSTGTLSIEARVTENGIDSQLTSSDFNFYTFTGGNYVKLNQGWPTATFDADDINQNINIYLAEETAASVAILDVLASVNLVDVTDGTSHNLTQEAFIVQSENDGTGYSLTGSGGTHKLFFGNNDVTTSAVHSVVGAQPQNGLTMSIDSGTGVYSLSGDSPAWTTDSETFTLRAEYENVDYDKIYTISKVRKGAQGSSGSSAVVVSLTASDYSIVYNSGGTAPDPTPTITLTATAQGVANGFFKFTGDHITPDTAYIDGDSQYVRAFTYNVPPIFFTDPHTIRVGVADGGDGPELAYDSITIYAIKPGLDGAGSSAYTIIVQNEAHTFTADNAGTVSSYVGSGTNIEAYIGATQLNAVTGVPTTNQYKISVNGTPTNITAGTINNSTTPASIDDHSGMGAGSDYAEIIYDINLENLITVQKKQTFSKSKEGDVGNTGPAGQRIRTVNMYKLNDSSVGATTAGTFASPLSGQESGWALTVPSLVSNGDKVYVSTRTFTDDAASPQDAVWSTPTVYAEKTDGATGSAGSDGDDGNDGLTAFPADFSPGLVGGYADFVFRINWLGNPGSSNPGEIQVSGTTFLHPDGTDRVGFQSSATVYTNYEGATVGKFWLMWTDEDPETRWAGYTVGSPHTNITPLVYTAGAWKAKDNDGDLYSLYIHAGQAQSAASTTITLSTGASGTSDFYNGKKIKIVSGLGIGQVRTISDYTGGSKVAVVDAAWTTIPDATSNYEIHPTGDCIIAVAERISTSSSGIDKLASLVWGLEGLLHASGLVYYAIGLPTGKHNGGDGQSILTDTTRSWTPSAWVTGFEIVNVTKGQSADITANGATTITGTLSGGADWDNNDVYRIRPVASATKYTFSTSSFTGLPANWQTTPVEVPLHDSTELYWSARYSVYEDYSNKNEDNSPTFDVASAAMLFGIDIQSDNFIANSSGWQIQRDSGDAEFNNIKARGYVYQAKTNINSDTNGFFLGNVPNTTDYGFNFGDADDYIKYENGNLSIKINSASSQFTFTDASSQNNIILKGDAFSVETTDLDDFGDPNAYFRVVSQYAGGHVSETTQYAQTNDGNYFCGISTYVGMFATSPTVILSLENSVAGKITLDPEGGVNLYDVGFIIRENTSPSVKKYIELKKDTYGGRINLNDINGSSGIKLYIDSGGDPILDIYDNAGTPANKIRINGTDGIQTVAKPIQIRDAIDGNVISEMAANGNFAAESNKYQIRHADNTAIATDGTVAIFQLSAFTETYGGCFVEITSYGLMQNIGAAVTTSTWHIVKNLTTYYAIELTQFVSGHASATITHSATLNDPSAGIVKFSGTINSGNPNSNFKSIIRISGDSCTFTEL